MNRGRITPSPQAGVSYANAGMAVPGLLPAPAGETLPALCAGAGLAGCSTSPAAYPNGCFPTAVAILAAGLL